MTRHAFSGRPTLDAICRLFCMAAPAQIMKLVLQQRPDLLVGHVTVHAQIPTCIVDIVVMAEEAILLCMIDVRE